MRARPRARSIIIIKHIKKNKENTHSEWNNICICLSGGSPSSEHIVRRSAQKFCGRKITSVNNKLAYAIYHPINLFIFFSTFVHSFVRSPIDMQQWATEAHAAYSKHCMLEFRMKLYSVCIPGAQRIAHRCGCGRSTGGNVNPQSSFPAPSAALCRSYSSLSRFYLSASGTRI